MHMNTHNKLVLPGVLLTGILLSGLSQADTIYQWTDPWGHIQYSKTPVPGASVSELTTLPPKQKITEQQKQQAMLYKLRQLDKEADFRDRQQDFDRQLRFQARQADLHCRKLRRLLADIRVRNSRYDSWERYYYPGTIRYGDIRTSERYLDPLYYQDRFMERDLEREIRSYCR